MCVCYISDYLKEKGKDVNFEELPVPDLATCLREFYASIHPRDGSKYSKSGFVNIRSSINRHLNSPPYNREINIMRDKQFTNVNQVFTGILCQIREAGLDVMRHKSAILPGDMSRMYTSGILSCNNAESLQNKVFVELVLHFGRRGQEGLWNLQKDCIVFTTDDQGREYASFKYNELDKNHQVLMPKEQEKIQIM